jgi:hypothetical protein
MSDDQDKALRDMLAYGTGVMMDGKHVPLDQYLLDDQILLFGEGNLPPEKLAALERMESAIRADERAKVVEECALAIDRDIHTYDSEMRSYAEGFAAAIRAKIGAEHE